MQKHTDLYEESKGEHLKINFKKWGGEGGGGGLDKLRTLLRRLSLNLFPVNALTENKYLLLYKCNISLWRTFSCSAYLSFDRFHCFSFIDLSYTMHSNEKLLIRGKGYRIEPYSNYEYIGFRDPPLQTNQEDKVKFMRLHWYGFCDLVCSYRLDLTIKCETIKVIESLPQTLIL